MSTPITDALDGFTPTHRITFTPERGDVRVWIVMLDDEGRAYDRHEWAAVDGADWSFDPDDGWRCLGNVTPGGESGEIRVEPITDEKPEQVIKVDTSLQVRDVCEPTMPREIHVFADGCAVAVYPGALDEWYAGLDELQAAHNWPMCLAGAAEGEDTCEHAAAREVVVDGIGVPLCEEHAAEAEAE